MIGIIGGGRNGTCGAGTSLPGVIPGGAGRYGTSGGFGLDGVTGGDVGADGGTGTGTGTGIGVSGGMDGGAIGSVMDGGIGGK